MGNLGSTELDPSTFSPVIRWATARATLAISWGQGWLVDCLDVSTAYLNARLDKDEFAHPPPEWQTAPGIVWRLRKSVYGMRRAGYLWNLQIDEYLRTELKLTRSKTDPSLYFSDTVRILLYVDDMMILTKDEDTRKRVLAAMHKRYKCRTQNTSSTFDFLGVQIDYTKAKLSLSQPRLVKKILEQFDMLQTKPTRTPAFAATPAQDQTRGNARGYAVSVANFRSFIGAVNFLASSTRFDIAHSVNSLAQKMTQPEETDLRQAHRMLRYLSGSQDFAISVDRERVNGKLVSYSDSNWDAPSVSGSILFVAGLPTQWLSRKQTATPLSSTEAEYVASGECYKEVAFLRQVIEELRPSSFTFTKSKDPTDWEDAKATDHTDAAQSAEPTALEPTPMLIDNRGAIYTASNAESKRVKHVKIRWHRVRDAVNYGQISVFYIPTSRQLADCMTKKLAEPIYISIIEQIQSFKFSDVMAYAESLKPSDIGNTDKD